MHMEYLGGFATSLFKYSTLQVDLSANTSGSDLQEKRLAWHQVNDQGEECEG